VIKAMSEQNRRCVAINIETASFPSALRLVFELFTDIVPKTCENFISLAFGYKLSQQHSKKPLTYTNSLFHRIIPGFMMQGGDFTHGDGTGGESIYGRTFEDETPGLRLKHDSAGLLSMANAGPNTNGSQFFILFDKARHLDGKHVIFGRLIEGMDALRQIEKIPTDADDKPLSSVKIISMEVMNIEPSSSVVLPSLSSSSVPRTIKELLGPGVTARVLATDMAEDGLPLSFGGRGSKANKNSVIQASNNTMIKEQMASLLREKNKAAELVRGVSSTIFGEIPQPKKSESDVGGSSLPLDSSPSDPSSTSSSTSAANAKLFALRLRMNAGRVDNHKEVVLEHTRKVDPSAEKRQRRLLDETDAAIEKSYQGNADDSMKRSRKEAPTSASFLAETALDAERRSYKEIEKNKRITDSYGWNVNSDAAMIHAHEKRLAALPSSAGVAQDAETETALSRVLAPGAALVPSSTSVFAPIGSAGIVASIANSSAYNIDPARVDRVVAELEATDARRSKFHRRRTVDARQDSAFVSEQNRGYNRKIAKEMDVYSIEIKQSLERGTK